MLKVKNITKTFGDVVALSDLSFDIDKGDFVFITGPSGSGKTTLIRLIIRDLLPDSGKILFDKVDLTELSQKEIPFLRQEIGVVFQDFKVLHDKTIRENIEIALAVAGIPQEEWNKRVEDVLSLVGMGKRSDFFPSQLSAGELQRISLARALVTDPKLILADEPTGNLDWDTADKIMDLFDKINKEGKTVIVATHYKPIVDKMKKKEIKLSIHGNKKKEENKKEDGKKKERGKKEKENKKEEEKIEKKV